MKKPMDYNDLVEDLDLWTKRYEDTWKEYTHAKYYLDIMLASRLSEFRKIRSNIGYDSGLLMLLEADSPEKEMINQEYRVVTEAKYKIAEKFLDKVKEEINLLKHMDKMAQ